MYWQADKQADMKRERDIYIYIYIYIHTHIIMCQQIDKQRDRHVHELGGRLPGWVWDWLGKDCKWNIWRGNTGMDIIGERVVM